MSDSAEVIALNDDAVAASAGEASAERRYPWSTVLRIAISVIALGIILTRIDTGSALELVTTMSPVWLLAAFASVYAAILVSAYKWQLLVQATGRTIGLARLARHYFVGFFFNNFLPTSVGGDVVRAWDAGADMNDIPTGAATVIAERLIASVALGVTALIGLPFVEVNSRVVLAVAIVAVVSIGLTGLFLIPSRSAEMVRKAMGGRFGDAVEPVQRAVHIVNDLLRNPGTLAKVFILSVVFQVFVALVNWCLFSALGYPVSVGEAIVNTSIVSAVTMVPISIAGHGVREAGYAYFFGLAGVPENAAVSASILFFLVVAVSTMPGALFFAQGRRQ